VDRRESGSSDSSGLAVFAVASQGEVESDEEALEVDGVVACLVGGNKVERGGRRVEEDGLMDLLVLVVLR